ncbi:DUF7263 family protein [Halobellus limi]|uniref:Uncharacterized protein n=1 Tax=Halobellus limi TaxID=699433 RepID=A0A1H5YJ36_9EURY|nr:hypothetical protein [Halobellus limi]QCC48431.1 hypothetical protein DV707_12570 [Halobellus limi]SEG24143.1 hypothetical protein SAMN04488133_1618 [Halobellus limi]
MTERAQATLIGFAVALVVVTTVTVAGATLANDALVDANRDPASVRAAESLAAHLVDEDAAHTSGQHALDADAVSNLSSTDLDDAVPPARGRPVRVSLGGETVLEREGANGSIDARSPRIERRVRVVEATPKTRRVAVGDGAEVAVDDHDGRVSVRVETDPRRTVTTVRAGGRVVLHDPSGLAGRYDVSVPRRRPLVVAFESGGHGEGTATVRWTPRTGTVERLVVTVGA